MKKAIFIFLAVILVLISLPIIFYYLIPEYQNFQIEQGKRQELKKVLEDVNRNFFRNSLPKPIEALSLDDIPSYSNIGFVVKVGSNFWLTGDNSIIEYDTKRRKIINFSNPKYMSCHGDIVSISGFLFAICDIQHISALNSTYSEGTNYGYGWGGKEADAVIKINPVTHQVIDIFSPANGLLNTQNLRLYPDGNQLWVATFNGIGLIDATDDKLIFYHDSLPFVSDPEGKVNIVTMLVDKKYVWAVPASGGLYLFDKQKEFWQMFRSEDIQDNNTGQIELENNNAIKIIPGGIQIGFREHNQEVYVDKTYDYNSNIWTEIFQETFPFDVEKHLLSEYPQVPSFPKVENGLTQITYPTSSTTYLLNGRYAFQLSPVINGKRYLLTNATIDIITKKLSLPEIFIRLGKTTEGSAVYGQFLHLFIDNNGEFGIIINSGCTPIGNCETPNIWLVDLQQGKVLRTYATILPAIQKNGFTVSKWKLQTGSKNLIIKNETGNTMFQINTETLNLIPAN